MKKKTKPLLYHIVRILDIFYVSNLYLILGIILSGLIDKYIVIDYDSSRGYLINFLFLLFLVCCIALSKYIIQYLIKFYIPFPLDGVAGFKHKNLPEINGNVILTFAFLIYLRNELTAYSNSIYSFL